MSMHAQPTIRAPWPDELARAWKFLASKELFQGEVYPLVALVGEPQRIVAASALQMHTDGEKGRLFLRLRTAFLDKPLASQLLAQIDELAQQKGIQSIGVILAESDPLHSLLLRQGFSSQRTDEWWCIDVPIAKARAGRAAELVNRPKIAAGFSRCRLDKDNLDEALAIAAQHGLIATERLGNREIIGAPSNSGYNPDLSVVVRYQDSIAGVLLVRKIDDTAFVHARAVAKRFMHLSNQINAHFMAHMNEPQYHLLSHILFSAQPTVEKETIALAKRFTGRKIASFSQFVKRSVPPNRQLILVDCSPC